MDPCLGLAFKGKARGIQLTPIFTTPVLNKQGEFFPALKGSVHHYSFCGCTCRTWNVLCWLERSVWLFPTCSVARLASVHCNKPRCSCQIHLACTTFVFSAPFECNCLPLFRLQPLSQQLRNYNGFPLSSLTDRLASCLATLDDARCTTEPFLQSSMIGILQYWILTWPFEAESLCEQTPKRCITCLLSARGTGLVPILCLQGPSCSWEGGFMAMLTENKQDLENLD